MAKCRICGRRIDFVETPKGKYMPVDPVPEYFIEDPQGDTQLINYKGELVRCFIVDPPAVCDTRKMGNHPHWQSCNAEKLAQEKAAKAEKVREAKKKLRQEKAAAEAALEAARLEEQEAIKRQISFY